MDFLTEQALLDRGFTRIAGIDEAGRGPLAGPVAAAAVILDPRHIPEGINDSKKLSEKKREALYRELMDCARCSCVMIDHTVIDEINILEATKRAMREAAAPLDPDFLLIDGNFVIGQIKNEKSVVGGDARVLSVGAASIIAKVTRDRFMKELDERYPEYGFARHKGYGTREHIEAIRQYGPCPYHRRSFLTRIL